MPERSDEELILPAQWSARAIDWFYWYVRRLLAKKFFAVRMERSSVAVAQQLNVDAQPVMIVMNHCAWWDAIVFVFLRGAFCASRMVIAPMDRAQLKQFAIFRRFGVFGIDPENPRSLPAMVQYVQSEMRRDSRPVIMLTPQGRFSDARLPIVVRPGAAVLASKITDIRVVAVAVEYGFWIDARPEIFLRVRAVPTPSDPSTAGWQRAIAASMQSNSHELAALVATRDENLFECMIGGTKSKINPVYDLWLRVTGRRGSIDLSMRKPQVDRASRESAP